ncbi:TetR/AcrR family transcriptional regulator [Alkalilimnicola ehrlichii]|nr:TetR/AcrR family transcriptional regulator [Alkalilimnicola ehrlichii]
MSSNRRDHLLDTAIELFYRNGCHTTGIDKILAEAGVAKMTLYKHFKSKEDLVLAAAQRFHDRAREEFEEAVNDKNYTPKERLIAIFDVLREWMEGEGFRGCPSANLAVQYPDLDHPIHQAAADHKRLRIKYISGLAADAGVPNPETLGEQLVLLIEGATVMTQITGDLTHADQAKEAAKVLIDAALATAA